MKKFLSMILMVCLISVPMGTVNCFAKTPNYRTQQNFSVTQNEKSVKAFGATAKVAGGPSLILDEFSKDGKWYQFCSDKFGSDIQLFKVDACELYKFLKGKYPNFFSHLEKSSNTTYNLLKSNIKGLIKGIHNFLLYI